LNVFYKQKQDRVTTSQRHSVFHVSFSIVYRDSNAMCNKYLLISTVTVPYHSVIMFSAIPVHLLSDTFYLFSLTFYFLQYSKIPIILHTVLQSLFMNWTLSLFISGLLLSGIKVIRYQCLNACIDYVEPWHCRINKFPIIIIIKHFWIHWYWVTSNIQSFSGL